MSSEPKHSAIPSKSNRIGLWLFLALVITNGLWAANYFGQYLMCGYQKSRLLAHEELLRQTLAVLPVVATGKATREEVVEATLRNGPRRITYETANTVVIGDAVLEFDETGLLVRVSVQQRNSNSHASE